MSSRNCARPRSRPRRTRAQGETSHRVGHLAEQTGERGYQIAVAIGRAVGRDGVQAEEAGLPAVTRVQRHPQAAAEADGPSQLCCRERRRGAARNIREAKRRTGRSIRRRSYSARYSGAPVASSKPSGYRAARACADVARRGRRTTTRRSRNRSPHAAPRARPPPARGPGWMLPRSRRPSRGPGRNAAVTHPKDGKRPAARTGEATRVRLAPGDHAG